MLKGYTYEYITNDKGESCMSDANLHNPLTKYDHDEFPKQYQEPPGLQKEMKPVPDCGETSYKGAGKLKGRKPSSPAAIQVSAGPPQLLMPGKGRMWPLTICLRNSRMQKK